MSLREKLILVGFGAAICGGVAGGVIVLFGPSAPPPAPVAITAAPGGIAVNPRPGALPPLGATPAEAPIDSVLRMPPELLAADPRYATYAAALTAAAPTLRALSPERQYAEIARIKAEVFGEK